MFGDEKHLTVEKILNYCVQIKLVPTLIYYTLSHSEKQHRFRLVYILDRPVQTKKQIKEIYKFLTAKFKDYNVDTAPTSIASLFLGGKEIAHESNFFYTLNEEEKTVTNYDALNEYNEILKYTPYCIRNRKLCYKKATSKKKSTADENEEINYTEISNFIVYVDKRIQYDNGNETNTFYQVNCVVLDNPFVTLPPQLIDADKYAKGTYLLGTEWDKFAIIRSGRGNSDRLREVTQIFSKKTMTEETIYSHTGFRKINDKLCYLYHGGVVGDIENISVDLSRDNLQRYSLTDIKTNTKEDKFNKAQEAIKLSYSTLDVADYSITVPLIAITYLAPLYSMLAEQDILADFVLYIQGKSGTRKSSLAAIFLSHFGNFNRDNFPCTFRDTLNALEKKAYILKDTLNIIDDYNPEIFGNGKLFTVEKVFGMYGDRTGRERMSADGSTLKKAYTARGLGIITGETIPEVAQSRIARSLILNINEHSVNLQKLSYIQDNLKLLSYAMRKYIELIIFNEQAVRETIKLKFKEFMNSAVKTEHGRTAEIVATLKIGFYLFAQLLQTYEIINNEKEFNNLTQKAYECLDMLVENQSEQIKELKPTEMFFRAFEELLATKTIEVDTIVQRSQNLTMPTTNPSATFVGYRDWQKNCYYLYPQKIYSEIVKYYKATNEKFPLNEKNLWKYLEEEGYLYRTDKSRYTVQRKIYGQNRTVVEIRLQKEKPTQVAVF